MMEFLIEIPHEEQNCSDLIRFLRTQGDLTDFEWGCQNGVHTGWAVVTADNEAEARLVVPSGMRRKARVVRVAKFDAATAPNHEPALLSPAMLHMYKAFPCWW